MIAAQERENAMKSSTSRRDFVTALALSALALAGCATMNVSSYVERGVDLRQYQTYNWGPPHTSSTGDPRLDNNRFFDERVRAQVEKELAVRGFEKTTSGMPDLLVHYHASVTQAIDLRKLDRQYCEQEDCWPNVYDAGTLSVDLIDPRTDKVVWRGWAAGSIDRVVDDQEWLEAHIDQTIARILARLPRRL